MNTLTGENQIMRFRLLALQSAVKLEKLGMTRRGRSAKGIAIEELKVPKNSTHDQVIEAMTKLLEE